MGLEACVLAAGICYLFFTRAPKLLQWKTATGSDVCVCCEAWPALVLIALKGQVSPWSGCSQGLPFMFSCVCESYIFPCCVSSIHVAEPNSQLGSAELDISEAQGSSTSRRGLSGL